MRNYAGFIISILLFPSVLTMNYNQFVKEFKERNRTEFYQEFQAVDSEFDLEEAIANFKNQDYESVKEDTAFKLNEMSPRGKKGYNITSAEITKLIRTGEALIDTSGEKEMEQMRRSIHAKEMAEMRLKTKSDKPEGKIRVKRQGKFQEAAKVDNLKMLRIYLTMFKNLWSNSYTGGAHPFHHDVPKPICILFKHRIMQFLFPPIGDEKKTS